MSTSLFALYGVLAGTFVWRRFLPVKWLASQPAKMVQEADQLNTLEVLLRCKRLEHGAARSGGAT